MFPSWKDGLPVTVIETITRVCRARSVSPATVRGTSREREIVDARQEIVYDLYGQRFTTAQIAEYMRRTERAIRDLWENEVELRVHARMKAEL